MPPKKQAPLKEEETQSPDETPEEITDAELMAKLNPPTQIVERRRQSPDDFLPMIGVQVIWDYGAIKIAFEKRAFVDPKTLADQDREYDKLIQQLEHTHKYWAENYLPKLRRYGKPV